MQFQRSSGDNEVKFKITHCRQQRRRGNARDLTVERTVPSSSGLDYNDLAVERTAPTGSEEVQHEADGQLEECEIQNARIKGLSCALEAHGHRIVMYPENDGNCVASSLAGIHNLDIEIVKQKIGQQQWPSLSSLKPLLADNGVLPTPTVVFEYRQWKWKWHFIQENTQERLSDLSLGGQAMGIAVIADSGCKRSRNRAHAFVFEQLKQKERSDPPREVCLPVEKTKQIVVKTPVVQNQINEGVVTTKVSQDLETIEVDGFKIPKSIIYAVRCRSAGQILDEWYLESLKAEIRRLLLESKIKDINGIHEKFWIILKDTYVQQIRCQPQREELAIMNSTRYWLKFKRVTLSTYINYFNRIPSDHWVMPNIGRFIQFSMICALGSLTVKNPSFIPRSLMRIVTTPLVIKAVSVGFAFGLYCKVASFVSKIYHVATDDDVLVGGCDCMTKSIAVDCSMCRIVGQNCRCGNPKWNYTDRFCSACLYPANTLTSHVIQNQVCELTTRATLIPLPRCVTLSVEPVTPVGKTMRADAKIEQYKPARQCQRSNRRGLHLVSWATARSMPIRTRVTTDAMESALKYRALSDVPKPDPHEWEKLITFWRSGMEHEVFGELPDLKCIAYKDWNRRFPPRRQKQHDDGKQLYAIQGGKIYPRQYRTKAFVKVEKLLKGARFGPEAYVPRPIQGFEEIVNVNIGPFMFSVTLWLKRVLSFGSRVVFASGMNAEKMGKIFDGIPSGYSWMMDDFSQYDSTEGEECFQFFYDFCMRIGMKKYPNVAECLAEQFKTHGTTRQGHRYSVPYTMKSGAANTSCQNSLMNIISHLYCLHKQNRGVSLIYLIDNLHIVVNGDDNVLAVSKNISLDIQQLKEDMKLLGFVAKPEVCTKHTFTFCGMRPWPTHTGIVMGPDFERHAPKIGWALDKPQDPDSWMSGVLNGYWNTSQHVPFFRHLIRSLKKLYPGEEKSNLGSAKDQVLAIHQPHDVCDETWQMCFEVYGITKDMEEQFGKDLEQVRCRTGILTHPALRVLLPEPGVAP